MFFTLHQFLNLCSEPDTSQVTCDSCATDTSVNANRPLHNVAPSSASLTSPHPTRQPHDQLCSKSNTSQVTWDDCAVDTQVDANRLLHNVAPSPFTPCSLACQLDTSTSDFKTSQPTLLLTCQLGTTSPSAAVSLSSPRYT